MGIANIASCTVASDAVDAVTCATGYILGGSAITAGVCYKEDPYCNGSLGTTTNRDGTLTGDG